MFIGIYEAILTKIFTSLIGALGLSLDANHGRCFVKSTWSMISVVHKASTKSNDKKKCDSFSVLLSNNLQIQHTI